MLARAAVVAATAAALLAPACAGHYGYQIVAADLAAGKLAAEGVDRDLPAVEYAGYAALLLGAPAIHAAHHNWRRAGVSLGLRVVTAALVHDGLLEPDPSGAGDEGMAIRGMINGLLSILVIGVAEGIDAGALASGSEAGDER